MIVGHLEEAGTNFKPFKLSALQSLQVRLSDKKPLDKSKSVTDF